MNNICIIMRLYDACCARGCGAPMCLFMLSRTENTSDRTPNGCAGMLVSFLPLCALFVSSLCVPLYVCMSALFALLRLNWRLEMAAKDLRWLVRSAR